MGNIQTFAVISVLAFAGLSAVAGENLLPDEFVQELCRKPNTGVGYLKAEGAMPEGITVTTDRAHDPVSRSGPSRRPFPGTASLISSGRGAPHELVPLRGASFDFDQVKACFR